MIFEGVTVYTVLETPIGRIHLVGELHDTPNMRPPCNLFEILPRNIPIWAELDGFDAAHSATDTIRSGLDPTTPLKQCALQYIGNPSSIELINIRRQSPFYILEGVMYWDYWRVIFAVGAKGNAVRSILKRFEKELSQHIQSRASMLHFVKSLIDPDTPIPQWYMQFVNEVQGAGVVANAPQLGLKDMAHQLTPDVRQALLQFVKMHVEAFVDTTAFSPAMKSFDGTREASTGKPMVMEKYDMMRTYFIRLFAIIMDIYTLAKYFTERPPEVVIVAGISHVSRLMEFFLRIGYVQPESYMCVRTNASGLDLFSHSVDTSDRWPVAMIKIYQDPIKELHDFRARKPRI